MPSGLQRNSLLFCFLTMALGSLCSKPDASVLDGQTPEYLEPIPVEQLIEDLDLLFQTIEEIHPNMYAYTSKETFAPQRERLYRSMEEPMNRSEFFDRTAPVVAALQSGHTFLEMPHDDFAAHLACGGRAYYLDLRLIEEELVVADSLDDAHLPRGTVIEAIDGEEALEAWQRMASYFSAERRVGNRAALEKQGMTMTALWFRYGSDAPLPLLVKPRDGRSREYALQPASSLMLFTKMPKFVPRSVYFFDYLSDKKTGVIEFNSCRNLEAFRSFLKDTFQKLQSVGAENLIIDVRHNPGGNSQLGDALIDYLTDQPFRQFERSRIKLSKKICELNPWLREQNPDAEFGTFVEFECDLTEPTENPLRFKGPVYLLIGPITYSSAADLAAAMKCFKVATLIGEETTDTTFCYGDCWSVELPHTRLKLSVPFKEFVGAGDQCDGRGVRPDIEVKQSVDDFVAERDTVMQHTLRLIDKGLED